MVGCKGPTPEAVVEHGIRLDFIVDWIPAELGDRPQWVAWRVEMRGQKPSKVPIDARTSRRASASNPATWSSFSVSVEAARRHRWGIGYVFAADDPFAGIDIDHCIDPDTGDLAEETRVVVDSFDSYTEISPGGMGLKIWVRGKLPSGRRRQGNLEVYDTARFFTVTGRRYGERLTIEARQEQLEDLHRSTFGGDRRPAAELNRIIPKVLDESKVIELLCRDSKRAALWSGDHSAYPSQSEADQALANHLAYFTGGDAVAVDAIFRRSGLMRSKWDRAARVGQTYGSGTIERAIAGCAEPFDKPRRAHERWRGKKTIDVPEAVTSGQPKREAVKPPHAIDGGAQRRAVLVRMSDVVPEPVRWLWSQRIAIGKLNLMIGDPSVSKSYLALYCCAQLSHGLPMFGDTGTRPPSTSLYFCAEDGLADTVRPRLDRLGADSSRVYVPRGWQSDTETGEITLADVDVICGAIRETGATSIIVDPLQAWLGADVDMNRANQVRPILTRLALLAEAEGVAIVVLMHLRKAEAHNVLYRAMTSIDFVATARSVLLVARDPGDRERRVLAQAKPSLTAEVPSLAYRISDAGLAWDGEVEMTAEDLLAAPTRKGSPKLEDAKAFLVEALSEGWKLKDDLVAKGEKRGISQRTLERAGEHLKVRAIGIGGTKQAWWTLSGKPFVEGSYP